MEKKDGSSIKVASVKKVAVIGAGPALSSARLAAAEINHQRRWKGMEPPMFARDEADVPGAKEMFMELERCYKDQAYYVEKYMQRSKNFYPKTLEETYQTNRHPYGTWISPWQRKRASRLNTAAGLPAKRRSFVKYLKRHCNRLHLKLPNAAAVELLWVSCQTLDIFRISSPKPRSRPSVDGSYAFGSAVYSAMRNGNLKAPPILSLLENEQRLRFSKDITT